MANILVKGIARYVHAFTPSAPPGTTERRYSIDVLVHKSDAEFLPQAQAALEADKQATFPQGMPPRADVFITDLATVPGTDPRLHEYMSVRFSTREADGSPAIVNAQRQPVINPSELQPGDIVYVSGNTQGYTVGSQGVKAYFNGVMLTGQKGSIPTELLSARPSAEQMFANLPGAPAGQPQYNTQGQLPPAPAPVNAPPAAAPPPAPVPPAPAAPPTAQFVMTPAANGVTRESYHEAGWTDEQLISNGLMLPPGGASPSFMG